MDFYDYSKLRGRITEVCGSMTEFSKRMHLTQKSISLKINNKISFKQREIETALDVLDIERREIPDYFFAPKVQNIRT